MEYVSLLAGEPFSDTPSCTHPVLAKMAQVVNDKLSDADRPQLVPLIGRLFGTAPFGTDLERRQLSVRLAVWCARQALPLVRPKDQQVCANAINAAQAWADNPDTAAASASYAAYAAASANANAYTSAAAYAAAASANANAASLVGLLTGLLDEYDRLTGRNVTDPNAPTKAQEAWLVAVGDSRDKP